LKTIEISVEGRAYEISVWEQTLSLKRSRFKNNIGNMMKKNLDNKLRQKDSNKAWYFINIIFTIL